MKQFPAHIVAVFGIVENDKDEILLIKNRGQGTWTVPGGQVEVGENLIDALMRETKEESNMIININKMYSISSNTCTYQGYNGYGLVPTKVMIGFICSYISGDFKESDETTESQWVHKNKVLDFLSVAPDVEKYKAYLEFNGEIRYLEYITKPEYDLKFERFI